MALESDDDAVALRRTQVAAMRLQGRTQREMARILDVSLGTVNRDLQAVRDEWATRREQSYNDWVAEELALLDRLQRSLLPKAIEGNDRAVQRLLSVMERRARMLGLDQPEKFLHQVVTVDMIDAEIARLERELTTGTAVQTLELPAAREEDDDETADAEQ